MMLVSLKSELQLSSSPSLGKISFPLDTPSSESGAHALSALASLLYGLRVVTKINADWTLVFASACLWLLLYPAETPSSESGAHALSALASLLYGLRVVTKINADWTLVFASACLWLLLGASGAVRCGHSKRCQCFHASPMPSIHPRQI
ncbi:hypothetical protein PR001_g3435 [Phytophthora rubi]|uniref:Uncharacterized protein n=1 Tax=Phytophthora rubi TaxID=129364 RepID=A0A6A3NXC4_9STRA|nr:hypothetical protein PR001_g3435 [Phytophthora rubi]